jgi:hypothetical protein
MPAMGEQVGRETAELFAKIPRIKREAKRAHIVTIGTLRSRRSSRCRPANRSDWRERRWTAAGGPQGEAAVRRSASSIHPALQSPYLTAQAGAHPPLWNSWQQSPPSRYCPCARDSRSAFPTGFTTRHRRDTGSRTFLGVCVELSILCRPVALGRPARSGRRPPPPPYRLAQARQFMIANPAQRPSSIWSFGPRFSLRFPARCVAVRAKSPVPGFQGGGDTIHTRALPPPVTVSSPILEPNLTLLGHHPLFTRLLRNRAHATLPYRAHRGLRPTVE